MKSPRRKLSMTSTVARSVIGYLFVGLAVFIIVLLIGEMRMLLKYYSIAEILRSASMLDVAVGFAGSIGLLFFGLAVRKRKPFGESHDEVCRRKLWIYLSLVFVLACLAVFLVVRFHW